MHDKLYSNVTVAIRYVKIAGMIIPNVYITTGSKEAMIAGAWRARICAKNPAG